MINPPQGVASFSLSRFRTASFLTGMYGVGIGGRGFVVAQQMFPVNEGARAACPFNPNTGVARGCDALVAATLVFGFNA
jgi:hypothetical protein